ncbi:MAG TPA: hypothetical protein VK599_07080 [Streptosporangiaceae bacterium]|nr:hypothetical protein [Streptosporangiaceae bacterium]
MTFWHWLVHFFGLDFGAAYGHLVPYDFWSGTGSDLAEASIPVALAAGWRKHNCHEHRCWRLGRHLVDGTPWCDRHHQGARKRERG